MTLSPPLRHGGSALLQPQPPRLGVSGPNQPPPAATAPVLHRPLRSACLPACLARRAHSPSSPSGLPTRRTHCCWARASLPYPAHPPVQPTRAGALELLLQKLPKAAAGTGAAGLGEADAALLRQLLAWPAAQLFPALDLARLAVLDAQVGGTGQRALGSGQSLVLPRARAQRGCAPPPPHAEMQRCTARFHTHAYSVRTRRTGALWRLPACACMHLCKHAPIYAMCVHVRVGLAGSVVDRHVWCACFPPAPPGR